MLITSTFLTIKSKRHLKSYAGVDLATYQVLHESFLLLEQAKQEKLKNRPNRKRQYGGGDKARLLTVDDKLLFILHYYKTYPTMDNLSTFYKMSRSSAWNYVHGLSGQLHQILVDFNVMPLREMPSVEEFKAFLEANKVHQLIIDVTERNIERPKDKTKNRAQYSGKKNDTPLKIPS
jgi:hypothetical protein